MIICDFCNDEMFDYNYCVGCRQEVCKNCDLIYYDSDSRVMEKYCQFPSSICKECDKKSQTYIKAKRDKIDTEQISILIKEWIKACLATNPRMNNEN